MGKRPRYGEIDGMLFPPSFVPEVLRDAMAFQPGKDDVVVATYPKCGTTWALQIVSLILRRGEPIVTAAEYFSSLPFLEMTTMEHLSQMKKPRCIKTHLSFDRITYSKDAKYVYVARHPADALVSFFHHTRFFPIYFYADGKFDDFFELFIQGKVDWNDYFDNLLSWYECRNEPNILLLTYESMIADHRGTCLQIARFLGEDYYGMLTADDEAVLKKVLEYSSMEYMKSTVNEFWKEEFTNLPSEEFQQKNPVMRKYAQLMEEAFECGQITKGDFIRKGVVGQGEVTLSKGQVDRLNDRMREKTAHSDVMSLWE